MFLLRVRSRKTRSLVPTCDARARFQGTNAVEAGERERRDLSGVFASGINPFDRPSPGAKRRSNPFDRPSPGAKRPLQGSTRRESTRSTERARERSDPSGVLRVRNLLPQIPDLRQQWSVPGSNRRPPRCKRGALPAELTPHAGAQCRGSSGVWPPRRPRSWRARSPALNVCGSASRFRPPCSRRRIRASSASRFPTGGASFAASARSRAASCRLLLGERVAALRELRMRACERLLGSPAARRASPRAVRARPGPPPARAPRKSRCRRGPASSAASRSSSAISRSARVDLASA